MGRVREDPSSGELCYHFVKAVLSTHERWTELLCLEVVLGTEESIVEINPEKFANHPEPQLALPPNHRERMLLSAMQEEVWPYDWKKPVQVRNRPEYEHKLKRIRGDAV